MKKILLLLFAFFLLLKLVSAQTSLTIVGTAHEPTAHFNSDTLFDLLKKIKPDVILMELDTNLMDPKGNFKRWAINDVGNEHIASVRYRDLHPGVLFRGFDIAGRSVYYQEHNTMQNENRSSRSMDSLLNTGQLSPENTGILTRLYRLNDTLNRMYNSPVSVLNSVAYMDLARRREFQVYKKLPELMQSTPALNKWYAFEKDDADFWDIRNHTMVNNILGYINTFRGKNIVVLTGAMHKYYLTDGLKPKQKEYHFKLMDLPE